MIGDSLLGNRTDNIMFGEFRLINGLLQFNIIFRLNIGFNSFLPYISLFRFLAPIARGILSKTVPIQM